MNARETLAQIEEIIYQYIHAIDSYTEEEFALKPSPEEWSIGQMIQHLLDTAKRLQLPAITACADGTATPGGDKTEAGKRIFAEGSFPATRIKLPDDPRFIPGTPSKEEAKNNLAALLEALRRWEPKLPSIPPNRKAEHPAMGYLDAHEWFQSIEMHFRHHLHQKKRIDQWLKNRSHS